MKRLTREKMLNDVCEKFGPEHPITMRFLCLVEWGFEPSILRTAYQTAMAIDGE